MSSNQKKIIGTTTAIVLVLALGLAGTFAASGSEDSTGNIEGTVDTSIFLHDDFSTNWDGDVRDRDVYVENTGDTSLYVRMSLDEFMSYGGKKLVGGDKTLTSTWKPHIPAGTSVTDCGTDIHDYFTIQMGNDIGIKYKSKTKNAYNPAITEADKTKTTSTANIMLIEDYLNAETKPDACWVLDTADGYAYWHTQLPKGGATGLILNSITNTGLIDESYYYGINAKAEAVTEMDLNAWFWGQAPKDSKTGEAFDQASTNAIRLLKNMSPKYIEITQEMKDNGAKNFDSDNDGYLTKKENADYEAEKGVTNTPKPNPDPGIIVYINSVNFPDNVLRAEVQTKDSNGDGALSKEEIETVTSLYLSGKGVTDFKGLEHFTALTDLDVSNNDLTEVNFLNRTPKLMNLNVSNNQLTSLSLAKGALTTILEAVTEDRATTQLANVNCSNNRLTGLDLSSAPGLTTLNCNKNQITKLDINSNASLNNITATGQTTTVNVTYNTTSKKYKGGTNLFAAGTTFGADDAAYDSTTEGLILTTLTTGKTSTYILPLKYSDIQKGTLSGTITFTGTIYIPTTVKEKVNATAVGGTVQLANKDGSKTEWIVYNKTASEADLITKYCIENRKYHEGVPGTLYPGWPNSDIRKWLNDGTNGYKSQLSDDMKAAIKAQTLTTARSYNNWGNPSSSTDEIYLLTETGNGSGKVGKNIEATVTLTTEQLKSNYSWWLRSPRSKDQHAGSVASSPSLFADVVWTSNSAARPALTININ